MNYASATFIKDDFLSSYVIQMDCGLLFLLEVRKEINEIDFSLYFHCDPYLCICLSVWRVCCV